jgi:hypothetical protein
MRAALPGRHPKEVDMSARSRWAALGCLAVVSFPLIGTLPGCATPAVAEVPPDQERLAVFELFTPPQTSGGG